MPPYCPTHARHCARVARRPAGSNGVPANRRSQHSGAEVQEVDMYQRPDWIQEVIEARLADNLEREALEQMTDQIRPEGNR